MNISEQFLVILSITKHFSVFLSIAEMLGWDAWLWCLAEMLQDVQSNLDTMAKYLKAKIQNCFAFLSIADHFWVFLSIAEHFWAFLSITEMLGEFGHSKTNNLLEGLGLESLESCLSGNTGGIKFVGQYFWHPVSKGWFDRINLSLFQKNYVWDLPIIHSL